jgi:hypothetical protein
MGEVGEIQIAGGLLESHDYLLSGSNLDTQEIA